MVLPTSVLRDHQTDPLFQSYTVRPTTLPRTSGFLTVGFSADQFSDDAVGEVWEGIRPSSLGRHRERQLAAALAGEDFLLPFPEKLHPSGAGSSTSASLPAFAVFEDGKAVLTGRFEHAVAGTPRSPSENPVGYLADLRQHAMVFIEARCPSAGKTTTCVDRLLGPDAIEWAVTWVADDIGKIEAVELLHERRFSGLGSTVNVVFGQ